MHWWSVPFVYVGDRFRVLPGKSIFKMPPAPQFSWDLIQIVDDISLHFFQRTGRNENIRGNGRRRRCFLLQRLDDTFQTGNPFILTFDCLLQFRNLHIVLKITGGKGVLNALGDMPDVPIVFRVGAGCAAEVVDGVNIVPILLKHKHFSPWEFIPFSFILPQNFTFFKFSLRYFIRCIANIRFHRSLLNCSYRCAVPVRNQKNLATPLGCSQPLVPFATCCFLL